MNGSIYYITKYLIALLFNFLFIQKSWKEMAGSKKYLAAQLFPSLVIHPQWCLKDYVTLNTGIIADEN